MGFAPGDDQDALPSSPTTQEPQVFLAISYSALTGTLAPRIVRFLGSVQGIPLQMLLDSSSSSSFISESVVARLQNVSVLLVVGFCPVLQLCSTFSGQLVSTILSLIFVFFHWLHSI